MATSHTRTFSSLIEMYHWNLYISRRVFPSFLNSHGNSYIYARQDSIQRLFRMCVPPIKGIQNTRPDWSDNRIFSSAWLNYRLIINTPDNTRTGTHLVSSSSPFKRCKLFHSILYSRVALHSYLLEGLGSIRLEWRLICSWWTIHVAVIIASGTQHGLVAKVRM